jgi:hypothetical protein
MATGGTYRIQSTTLNKEFPAPVSTEWSEQPISNGLNGVPVNSGYKNLVWNLEDLLGSDFADLAALFDEQQDNNSQLSELETDPYPSDLSCDPYGTVTYSDFFIRNITRTRGLPNYIGVTVEFEVWVG